MLSISYTFSPTTVVESGQVNQNFTDIVDYINETVCVSNGDGAMVAMWKGDITKIPTGWSLDTDLKDRMIMGAGNLYNVGATGGEATHVLTIDEMPAHTHTYTAPGDVLSNDNGSGPDCPKHTVPGTNTSSTGGDGAHNNLPPYYALAFILKT